MNGATSMPAQNRSRTKNKNPESPLSPENQEASPERGSAEVDSPRDGSTPNPEPSGSTDSPTPSLDTPASESLTTMRMPAPEILDPSGKPLPGVGNPVANHPASPLSDLETGPEGETLARDAEFPASLTDPSAPGQNLERGPSGPQTISPQNPFSPSFHGVAEGDLARSPLERTVPPAIRPDEVIVASDPDALDDFNAQRSSVDEQLFAAAMAQPDYVNGILGDIERAENRAEQQKIMEERRIAASRINSDVDESPLDRYRKR